MGWGSYVIFNLTIFDLFLVRDETVGETHIHIGATARRGRNTPTTDVLKPMRCIIPSIRLMRMRRDTRWKAMATATTTPTTDRSERWNSVQARA